MKKQFDIVYENILKDVKQKKLIDEASLWGKFVHGDQDANVKGYKNTVKVFKEIMKNRHFEESGAGNDNVGYTFHRDASKQNEEEIEIKIKGLIFKNAETKKIVRRRWLPIVITIGDQTQESRKKIQSECVPFTTDYTKIYAAIIKVLDKFDDSYPTQHGVDSWKKYFTDVLRKFDKITADEKGNEPELDNDDGSKNNDDVEVDTEDKPEGGTEA